MLYSLVFDYDNSLSSIGGESTLVKTFGLPPIQIHQGVEQTKSILRQLITPVKRKIKHPLFNNVAIEEDGFELTSKAMDLGLGCLVFDTVSALGLQERNQIKHRCKIETFDQRAWGQYGDSINSFIYTICSLPVKTIFNGHIERERNASDEVIELPSLKGGSKYEVDKWFDVILYTHVIKDRKKSLEFCWLTKPSRGKFAKDRLGVLPEIIPQDFSIIFSKYEEAGIKHPNILVLGDSGTGKTKALETLSNLAAISEKEFSKAS